jgi:hypothetical protein
MGAGLALGVLIVGVLEYRDSTFKTDEDLSQLLGIHVFAVVPLIQSDAERKRAWRRRMALGAVMGSVVIGCLAIFGYTLVR